MPTFTTDFLPPDAPEDLTIEADIAASAVRLTWAPSTIPDVDFGGFRVYRSVGGDPAVLIAQLAGVNDVAYDDFDAPLNVTITYQVTQANLDFESDPAVGTVTLSSLQWWVVVPDDPTLTFAIPKVRSASMTSPKVQDFFSPIGRETRVAVGDVVQTETGSLSFLVMPDNQAMITLLHRVQARMDGVLLLKAPDGYIHYVQYGDVSRSFTEIPGMQELTLPFYGVG